MIAADIQILAEWAEPGIPWLMTRATFDLIAQKCLPTTVNYPGWGYPVERYLLGRKVILADGMQGEWCSNRCIPIFDGDIQ